MALHLPIGPLKTRSVLEPVPRCEPRTYHPLVDHVDTAPSSEKKEGVVALHLPIRLLKTCSGLEPVPRCEPRTYNPLVNYLYTAPSSEREEGVVALHLPTGPLKPALGWSRYQGRKEGRKQMFYLTTHSTHFIYGYMASDPLVDELDTAPSSERKEGVVVLYPLIRPLKTHSGLEPVLRVEPSTYPPPH